MAQRVEEVAVVVVGAGPAGLAAAIELSRHDVPTLLVERRTEPSSHPRATGLSVRSMELVRAWGVERDVRARSVDVDARMLLCETLADAAVGAPVEVGYPSREQSRMVSPTEPACLAQDDLESVLFERVHEAAAARVELGVELVGLVAAADGARVELRDMSTGARRAVDARYVVAADGAWSTVRRSLGIPLVGPENVLEGWRVLFRAPMWDVVGEHRHLLYSVTHRAAPGVFLPAGRTDRWLFGLPGPDDAPDGQRAAELLRLAAGVPDLPVHVEETRRFSSTAQLAERWRGGTVFLAGDAAHRVTPRGGMGLNLALQDGYDLGWRLSWVLRGWAAKSLLDCYEAERRPVAAHVAARSADPNGSTRPPEQEVRADLGGRIPHVWAAERCSTLDLLGPGLTLFAQRDGVDWEAVAAAAAMHVPVRVRLLDPVVARAVGAPGGSALLARSDGMPVGVLPALIDPVRALGAALATVAA